MAESDRRQALLRALRNNILAVWMLSTCVGLISVILWLISRRFALGVVALLVLAALALATFNYFVFYKRRKHLYLALNAQSVLILFIMTAGIHFTGGISSPLLWLYVLSIVVEGMSLGGYRAFTIATAANALLVSLMGLEFAGALPVEGFIVDTSLLYNAAYVATHLVSIVLFNYLMAFAVYFWAGMLFKQRDELKALDRAKDLFLSITSHELRTPLTPMKAQLQLLSSGYLGNLSQKQQESLDMVLKNTRRLEKLIGDVMDVSKISAGKMSLLPVKGGLERIIGNVVEIEQPLAAVKNIHIESKVEACPEFFFDPDRITQVMTNLLDNAIKYSGTDGHILVSLQKKEMEAVVGVSDTGKGISTEDQARLFTPFFQADPSLAAMGKGTGLGLVICKGIVEAHTGRIWVESVKGKGTSFYFSLPLRQEA